MTAAAKVDRLGRAVVALETALKANELVPSNSRKSISTDRERLACAEIREIIITNNFTSVYKEDHRYGDLLSKAIETVFNAVNHPDQGMRSFADESLDAILRSLLLTRNHSRVLVVLITELGRNGPTRSLVAAIGKLAQLIHLSKCSQRTRYAVHIINALVHILKRPEDSVQQAIISYAEVLFNTIGSQLKDQHREKIFELYRIALENLELGVSSNRAAVVIIRNICMYYPSILSNVLIYCIPNICEVNEKGYINRLIGSLNTLKSIWPLIVQSEDDFPDVLRVMLCRVLCCSYSPRSEVVVPTVELIERMMHTPLKLFTTFCPGVFDMKASFDQLISSGCKLSNDFFVPVSEVISLPSSSGSILDASSTNSESSNFNVSMESTSVEYGDISSKTKAYFCDEIIDPLMHADLYEKVTKKFSTEVDKLKTQLPKKSSDCETDIPQQLPTGICDSSANFYLYTAAMLGKRFLLSGLKGLKNDRDVRISHKILALNCLTAIAKFYDLSKAVVLFGEMEQSLLEVSRFVLHDDDMLCSSTVIFLFTVDKLRPGHQGNTQNYRRVMNAFQPIRKRALLQAAIGQQDVLEGLGLLSDALELSTFVQSTFFLFKVTCAEFISSVRWSSVQKSLKEHWQEKCLNAYFILLFEEDQKVSQAALTGFPKLIRNADFTEYSSIFVNHELTGSLSHDQDPLPVVLNLPSEYRFLSEYPDFAVESNLEVILDLMIQYATMDYNRRSANLCTAIDVLLEAFPPAVYSNCWNNIKRTSPSFGLLSSVIDLCELNLNLPHHLSTGINVIGKLFGGWCESSMVNVKLENKMQRMNLSLLPDSTLLDRLILIPLRVLNMYYSLIAEYRSTASQSTSSLLSRPTLSPLPSKKASSSRIADISRLLGTNIHPHKTTSFLECPTIKYMFSNVQGAHKNYMENIGSDREWKFLNLLISALNCLGILCEMMTFIQLKPLLEEIILYVKVTFDACPEGCCRFVHQLFKVVFGKNMANINLDVLQSMNMNDNEFLDYRYSLEFAKFSTLIGKKKYVDIIVRRRLGWLNMDMLSKLNDPPQNEIAPALELFEGIVNTLLHVYGAFQSIECKKAILRVMCELLRGRIIYTMVDPKKILFEAVMVQLLDPSSGNKELLREIALYLIILARNGAMTFDEVIHIAVELLKHANDNNAIEVLRAVEVITLEALYIQHLELSLVYSAFRLKVNNLFIWASQETLLLWILFLHDARIEERRWSSVSLDFFNDYSVYLMANEDPILDYPVYTAITSLSCMSPSVYRPLDTIFKLLEHFINDKESSIQTKLKRTVPLWFVLLNNVTEEKLLMRLEQIYPLPLEWISSTLENTLLESIPSIINAVHESMHTFLIAFLQIIENTLKSDSYPKLASVLKTRLTSIYMYSTSLAYYQPALFYQWIQLMSHCENGDVKVKHFLEQYAFKHGRKWCLMLSPLSHDICFQINCDTLRDRIANEYITKKPSFPDFVKTAFLNHDLYSNPDVYCSLLYIDSQDLYYVYDCVDPEHRRSFFKYLINAVRHYIKVRMVDVESYKTALVKSQEIVDVINDLIEYSDEDSCNSLILKTLVLAEMDTLTTQHHLQWPEFQVNEVITLLDFTATQMKTWMPHLDELFHGMMFMLRHASTKDLFTREPFHYLPSLQNVIAGIVKLLESETTVKYEITSSVDNFSLIIHTDHEFGDFHGGCEGFLRVLFDRIQYICKVFRSQCFHQNITPLQRFVTVLFRHPILNAFAIIPYTALKMNWKLRVEIRGSTVHVPLINIHMLCNLDILNDFIWRLNWLGWTSRQQFEDFWMSLFGVLSSTPTGNEITSDDSANIYEQILSSSVAVSVLTDILLHSLLYPEPGNPSFGKFLIKHRERTEPFYHSKSIQQLCKLNAELTGDVEPLKIYRRNIERISYNGIYYGLGQLSALSLWTLTGVLSTESSKKSAFSDTPLGHISLSDFLLKSTSELDTASLVRALFENYSHWFSRGLDFLPLPLLSATIRSMTLLSDLFDESASYEFLYVQMKNIFRGGYLMDHPDIGYVIYALLKSVTVVGLESIDRTISEVDLAKQILIWVETGLTSRSPFVREATLHGFSYILQSLSFDSLKPVFQYVNGFLLIETSKQLSVSDHINIIEIPASLEYTNLLWSVSFRVMEEPLQVSFKNSLIQKLCDAFMVMNISYPLLSVVTSGIESLIIHSSTYVEQFLPIVLGCLKDYTIMNSTLIFALRIFIVCIFREDAEKKSSAVNFEPILSEIYNVYRKCDLRDASIIASVLPSLLHRLFTEEHVLNILLDLCAPIKGTYLQNVSHSLRMMFEFCERLRESQRLSTLAEFSRVVLSNVKSTSVLSRDARAVNTCLLVSTSVLGDVAYRFPFYLDALHSSDSFENAFEWALFMATEEKDLP